MVDEIAVLPYRFRQAHKIAIFETRADFKGLKLENREMCRKRLLAKKKKLQNYLCMNEVLVEALS